jgi:hypothetical protein
MGRVFFNTRKNIVDIAAAKTVLPSDSGNVFMINQGAAYAITLPTPALAQRGWNAEFIVGTVAANAQTITCVGTDLFHGIGLDGEDGAAQTVTEGTGIDVITIISGATKGDRVGITCDGVSYYFVSFAADKAHITVAAE